MFLRYVLGVPATLICVVMSGVMAFRFGWGLGSTEIDQWVYAIAGVAIDVIKGLLPLLIIWAWRSTPRQWLYCIVASAFFALFSGYSLFASFGLAAVQSANKGGTHTLAATALKDRRAELDRLLSHSEKTPLGRAVDGAEEEAAKRAADLAEASAKSECDKRGPRCRDAEATALTKRAEHGKISADLAAFRDRRALDQKIDEARARLDKVDIAEATKEVDPQASAIIAIVGSYIGTDKDRVRSLLHALLAVVIEGGSGWGFYLTFGSHVRPAKREEEAPADQPHADDVSETPAQAVERFFLQCVAPALGERTLAYQVYANYSAWCSSRGISPVSSNQFGRMAQWRSRKVGGRIYYLDAQLRQGPLRLAVSNG